MTKVSAARAKKEYNSGGKILIAQSKVAPFHLTGGWHLGATVSQEKDGDWQKLINNFRYYNSDTELGKGIQYWIVEKGKSNPSRGRSLGTESSYPRVGRRVKRKTESRVSTALNKFMKCKAVRFNRNGSVSIKK